MKGESAALIPHIDGRPPASQQDELLIAILPTQFFRIGMPHRALPCSPPEGSERVPMKYFGIGGSMPARPNDTGADEIHKRRNELRQRLHDMFGKIAYASP